MTKNCVRSVQKLVWSSFLQDWEMIQHRAALAKRWASQFSEQVNKVQEDIFKESVRDNMLEVTFMNAQGWSLAFEYRIAVSESQFWHVDCGILQEWLWIAFFQIAKQSAWTGEEALIILQPSTMIESLEALIMYPMPANSAEGLQEPSVWMIIWPNISCLCTKSSL